MCFQDSAIPTTPADIWWCLRQTIVKKKKRSLYPLTAECRNLFGVISNELGPGHTLFQPPRYLEYAYACRTVLRKTALCWNMCNMKDGKQRDLKESQSHETEKTVIMTVLQWGAMMQYKIIMALLTALLKCIMFISWKLTVLIRKHVNIGLVIPLEPAPGISCVGKCYRGTRVL